jgi:hypothetical protein
LVGTEHLIPGYFHNKDILAFSNYFSNLLFKCNITIYCCKTTEKYHCTIIKAAEEVLADATSKSYRYSKSKAIKIALKFMTNKLSREYENNPMYQARLAERERQEKLALEKMKAEKQELHLKRKLEKESEKIQKQHRAKELARMRDQARRKAKQEANQRNNRF